MSAATRNVMIKLGSKLTAGGSRGFKAAGGAMKGIKNDVADFAKRFEKAAIAAGAFAVAAGLRKAIKDASEFQEIVGKFDVVFKKQKEEVKKWATDFAANVGRSRMETMKLLASMQDLLVPMGFVRSEASGLSKDVVTLAFDIASFNNLPTAWVIRDIQAALTGTGETMKKYGVVINQAKINQELLNMGIEGGKRAATDAQKVQAVWNMILRGTTDAQGDAMRTASSFANQMRRLEGNIENASVAIGTQLLPFVTDLAKDLSEWAVSDEGQASIEAFGHTVKHIVEDAKWLAEWLSGDMVGRFTREKVSEVLPDKFRRGGLPESPIPESKLDRQTREEGEMNEVRDAMRRAREMGEANGSKNASAVQDAVDASLQANNAVMNDRLRQQTASTKAAAAAGGA